MSEKDRQIGQFGKFTPAHESIVIGVGRHPDIVTDPGIKSAAIGSGLAAYESFLQYIGKPQEEISSLVEKTRNELQENPNGIIEFLDRYAGYISGFNGTKESPSGIFTSDADEELFLNADLGPSHPARPLSRLTSNKPNVDIKRP